ncbi:uncharacterized protein EV420DRAFT_1261217 [Desarmillaria tabescens]|uniref:ZZ-type domain-containing protein n=1 Tax=Armillaria tabescens TaxID=1929756 RepID=A0AA39TPV7_ARMTA|nr:uncharacterized protein EV420DRAFT_1261217 [Desarmillaria tabescens]KAK0466362.1 hypothetical protein EV420DRAFT_1261217 [Desarmillaria tabescens]
MFTVKATYRGETRKFTFADTHAFPSFLQLYNQLYRVFPHLSHSYFLSKLLFSPNSSASRILVAREVHSADEYKSAISNPSLVGRWPSPMLKFSVFDQSPHKPPFAGDSGRIHWGVPAREYDSPRLRLSLDPLCSSLPPAQPPPNFAGIPPPPILFSSPPRPQTLAPMDIDQFAVPPQPFSTRSPSPQPRSQSQWATQSQKQTSCCAVDQAKDEIRTLMDTFKRDLDRILKGTFGDNFLEQNMFSQPPQSVFGRPFIPPMACMYHTCAKCFKLFQGPWQACQKCARIVCNECYQHPNSSLLESPCVETLGRHPLAPGPRVIESPKPVGTPSAPPIIHHGVMCDCCSKQIEGIRHKCLDCSDYDLCTKCITTGGAEQHDPFHEFWEVTEPSRVIISRIGSTASPVPTPAPAPQAPTPAVTPAVHGATCNLCDSRIRGDRYVSTLCSRKPCPVLTVRSQKCVNCPDFDTCGSCYAITKEQHPHHTFVKISNPADYLRSNEPLGAMHMAVCNACNRSIFGVRYKCMHHECPDFDLCERCEAMPISVHPPNHPLLKMKSANTVIPTVYHVGQTTLIDVDAGRGRSPLRLSTPLSYVTRSRSRSHSYDRGVLRNPSWEKAPPHSGAYPFALRTPSPHPSPPMTIPEPLTKSNKASRPYPRLSFPELINLMEPASPTSPTPETFMTPVNQPSNIPNVDVAEAKSSVSPVVKSVKDDSPSLPPLPPPTSRHLSIPDLLISSQESLASETVTPNKEKSLSVFSDDTLPAIVEAEADFVGDVTAPDGQVFPPGAEFMKCWRMKNSGLNNWEENTQLVFVAGESFIRDSGSYVMHVGPVDAGDEVDVWTGELKAPEVPGRYIGYWRLKNGSTGLLFGESIWIDVVVAEPYRQQMNTNAASEAPSSMTSSSVIVMPNAPASLQPPLEVTQQQLERLSLSNSNPASPVIAPSSVDVVSIAGSDESFSGASLISAPSSDSSDEELWEDSRMNASTADSQRTAVPPRANALDYVVLYDENSSSEDDA